jgi:hypothetical protein
MRSSIIVIDAKVSLGPRKVLFDTNSVPIKVDNCVSACILGNIDNFVGLMMPVKQLVRGLAGITVSEGVMMRTLKWTIEDDIGMKHKLKIPHSYYVPGGKTHLLSPQHCAREARDNHPAP